MSHFEHTLTADLDALVAHFDDVIVAGSVSANLEESSDQQIGPARMVVRVYERFSALGGNRVSLGISILGVGDQLAISASTAGGSEAVFWKLNTFGEEAFLKKAVE